MSNKALENYKSAWLLGTKIYRNEGRLKTCAQSCGSPKSNYFQVLVFVSFLKCTPLGFIFGQNSSFFVVKLGFGSIFTKANNSKNSCDSYYLQFLVCKEEKGSVFTNSLQLETVEKVGNMQPVKEDNNAPTDRCINNM